MLCIRPQTEYMFPSGGDKVSMLTHTNHWGRLQSCSFYKCILGTKRSTKLSVTLVSNLSCLKVKSSSAVVNLIYPIMPYRNATTCTFFVQIQHTHMYGRGFSSTRVIYCTMRMSGCSFGQSIHRCFCRDLWRGHTVCTSFLKHQFILDNRISLQANLTQTLPRHPLPSPPLSKAHSFGFDHVIKDYSLGI